MVLRIVMSLGMLMGLSLAAQGTERAALPPTQSEKELQAPLTLEDGKPTAGQQPEHGPSGLRAFGSLVLVVGLVGASLWALKKYGRGRLPGSGGGKLRVEETLALGERRYVSILEAEGERFLIGLTPQGISLISRLDAGEQEEATRSFDAALARQVDLGRPMPVREMEALLKQGGGES